MYVVFLFRWPAMCIHGDKSQPERDWVLSGKAFKLHILLKKAITIWPACFHYVAPCISRVPQWKSSNFDCY